MGIKNDAGGTETPNEAKGMISARFDFDATKDHAVDVKVGISATGVEGARRNLQAEIPGWGFDKVRQGATKQWQDALGTIDIETKGLPELKALYKMLGADDAVMAKCFPQFGHNYNQVSREVMYNFFNKHLKLGHEGTVTEKEIEPISAEKSIAPMMSPERWPGSGAIRWYSAAAMRAAAPPPTPLKSATICGIAVIFTSRAEATPITVPIAIPTRISQYWSMSSSRNVKKIAIAIPTAAIQFPERAVGGEDRRRIPTMRSTAATR